MTTQKPLVVKIPDMDHRRLKAIVSMDGRKLQEVVGEIIHEYVESHSRNPYLFGREPAND